MSEWSSGDSDRLYGVSRWGAGYFSIDAEGFLCVDPLRDGKTIRIAEVIASAREQELRLPLHIRFQDILLDRVRRINEAFSQAIADSGYLGRYQGVFPVKVNQMREVVETILDAGSGFALGLEAGSKPELLLALALHRDEHSLLICNGYKDHEFLRFALMGLKLGKQVIVVAEKLSEIEALIEVSQETGIRPLIGIRVKLSTRGSGKWASSSGEAAKFGLSTVDLLEAIEVLEKAGLKDCIRLVHFHIGSQIPDIQVISRSVREGARFYAKLVHLGCPLTWLDLGGGLGVDYDGSRSAVASSANYSLREYAASIVSGILDVCDEEKVPHPVLVSESGRALVAHHSLIAVEAFGRIKRHNALTKRTLPKSAPKVVRDILEVRDTVYAGHFDEALHDLAFYRQQAMNLFDLGYLDLQSRAFIESLSWELYTEIAQHYEGTTRLSDEVRELIGTIKDQYLLNFSVFRALPDSWALGQLFPVVPLQRLCEEPLAKGTIVDITCDSDGKIDHFIADGEREQNFLWFHDFDGKPYYLGFFLTGAYQDTLGDMHNLFGRMDEAHVILDSDEKSGWYIGETIAGDTVSEVLEDNEYSVAELTRAVKQRIDRAIRGDIVKPSEGMSMLAEFEAGLKRYTYLTVSPPSP